MWKSSAKIQFLESIGIKDIEKARMRKSKTFPGTTFFVESKYARQPGSAIVEVPSIGPVAINFFVESTLIPKDLRKILARQSKRRDARKHEEAHVFTNIIRHNPLAKLEPTEKRHIEEKLLSELIGRTAAGKRKKLQALGTDALDIYIMTFARDYSKKNGFGEKERTLIEAALRRALTNKLAAIEHALLTTPRGEVIITLRQTSWNRLEKDLLTRSQGRAKHVQRGKK